MIFTCNAVEFTSHFKTLYTITRHSNANVDLKYLVSLKCSRFYPHAHCSPTCGAYIVSQRSVFSRMVVNLQGFKFKDIVSAAAGI